MRIGWPAGCAILLALVAFPPPAHGWGLAGHKTVTDRAVRLLPTKMQGFYWENRNVLADLSIEPDLRKDSDPAEGPRHYIDLELYPSDLPKRLEDAVAKFGMKKLSKGGWVPWHTQKVYADLVAAMRRKDYPGILRLSGDLSHYVGDMHVPLHTTENYDGQLTTDTGVHARFESLLVDQFPEVVPFEPRPASRIVDIPSRCWAIIVASSTLVNDVLVADRKNAYPDVELDGYSMVSARQTHGPIAARRMNNAAQEVASFWYSAWVEAGRPDLPRVDFSSLARPPTVASGEAVFYEGRFVPAIPADWPILVRESTRRIGEYLRLVTRVRLATLWWYESKSEIHIQVRAIDSTGAVDERRSERDLKRLILDAKIRFRSKGQNRE